MHKIVKWSLGLSVILFIIGCSTPHDKHQDQHIQESGQPSAAENAITQISTVDALLAGVYDGHMSLETLRTYGDFGIGTFEGLDGEMVLFDGVFYQVKADGKIYQPGPETLTPFACVIHFTADCNLSVTQKMDMKALEALIDSLVPQKNHFVAFRLHGLFDHMHTRSVPAQTPPYPPLEEVARSQPEFDMHNLSGTLVGFRSPAFVQGVNVPGFHMHFVADDLSGGGHILGFTWLSGHLEMDTLHSWLSIYMPTGNEAFSQADLSVDRSRELHYVEKGTD